ncbi:zinc finger MYND domain-containing protein 10-like [Gigantopelta aegis]|uniref:zinc finger MYND domain-containing protein 10-like n=1 Tax=Gigantopelta aegis TaxID=1735272 RepID=UPI001B888EE8|nr:zinc finger MYND domain-containing protein 10-like [Gigantopelta aegis]
MLNDGSQVLLSVEAEAYLEALEKFTVKDVGNISWTRQHEHIEKLNMQAAISASAHEDEFVKESLISLGKIPVLIHDLLVTEVWKEKVFPELLEMEFNPKTTFPLYMVLYHEATVANLLETVMFHCEVCESADDAILDLVDYCNRKLVYLVTQTAESDDEADITEEVVTSATSASTMEELERLSKKLDFDISIKALSLLRYVTDHFDVLPLSIMTRILNTHDIPIILVELVQNPPWTRRKEGQLYKYIENKWQQVSNEDRFKVTKIEGQIWIALFHLLMEQNCQQKYDLNSHRKNTLLKLRSHLTEVMLDQLPILAEMQRYLEQLSMVEPPPFKKDLVLEQVPEIRDGILRQFDGRWSKLAKHQAKTTFNPTDDMIKEQAKRFVDTYNFDILEGLLTDPPKCAVCGEPASKRCSRCQNEWYCRRECQVNHWKRHKKACDLLFESEKNSKQAADKSSQPTS